ncbi:J domain-containing protein [Halosimplex halophilum]|uniref:J domain-containing protein n=1 Tax=Halosimplex halophilum TaxID=2559572 RepID=UPI001AE5EED6|nr:DnaJ domain-containing protein [Halosimplex halophilum]
MNGTFYGVLGVGPDADEEAIRAAYRERVKEHHPDVSADPDAADRFRRLTVAKETLLDAAERARYDRLGHRAYVESHADPSLWTTESSTDATVPSADDPTDGARDGSDGAGDGARDASDDPADGPARNGSTGTWAGRTAESRRSPSARSSTATGSATEDRARRTTTGATGAGSSDPGPAGSGSGSASSGSTGPSSGRASNGDGAPNGGDGAPGDGGTTGGATATATAGGAAASGPRSRESATGDAASGARRRTRRPSGSYATTSFWGAAESRSGAGRSSDPATRRALTALRRLGPWILVHVLFLSLAVGTGWYVYAVVLPPAERSAALLFVLIGEVGLAVVLSSLHILSRLYR